MLRSEDAVIPINSERITYLVGEGVIKVKPLIIYSDIVCDFLEQLSKGLRQETEIKEYPDILTFAFWCRRANINKLKTNYLNNTRVGKGLVFHIAPSNIPINFAFSFVFGLLAGNANIVRVSKKRFRQTDIICKVIRQLFREPKYEILAGQNMIVSYGHEEEINQYFSQICDIRVIWGGDQTIKMFRKFELKPRATEITFANRYSFAIFDESRVDELDFRALKRLAEEFYNDTYLMDQNACSSPNLILWYHSKKERHGRKRFWKALAEVAQKYELTEKKVIDKYTLLCETVTQIPINQVHRIQNILYVISLEVLPDDITCLKGRFGMFFESDMLEVSEIIDKVSDQVQTCVVYGMDSEELWNIFLKNHILGIDRIVQVGQAMNIGVYWDGYDVIGNLSRIVMYSK